MISSHSAIELVIFDLTGTTVWDGDGAGRCLAEALRAVDVTVTDEQIRTVSGFSKPSAIRRLLSEASGARPSDDLVQEVHDAFASLLIAHYQTDGAVAEMPGATMVLKRLKEAGLRVALDTGVSRRIVDAVLDRLGWRGAGLWDATVASDEVSRGRPDPDLVLEAMRRTGVKDVKSTAKVGDTPADLLQGMAAGCGWVVGVTTGSHSRAQLARHPHTHLISSLGEFPGLLGLKPLELRG